MKYRQLKIEDIYKYIDDISSCYTTNTLVFDSQNPLKNITTDKSIAIAEFVRGFVEADDSSVMGIFDSEEHFLYGLVIFDNIRFADNSCAQVHIVNDKSIFGKRVSDVYKDIIKTCMIDVLYAEIPSIAVHAIGMCKRLGFKKTGYIPYALPYINSKGEEKMYDLQIWSLVNNND